MVIFWGSQSGTAQRMANRLAKECHQRFGIKALSVDASDYEASTIAQIPRAKLAIFVASTFGEGDPPDSYHSLWSWLHETSDKSLAALKYMAFGLGNSNYKHYNEVIKVVVDRLDALGAQSLLPTGMADDAQGETEEHYLEWKEQVFKTFSTQLGYTERDPIYEPSLQVFEDESLEPIDLNHGVPAEKTSDRKTNHGMSAVYSLPVKGARELFQVSEHRNCIHMEIDFSEHPEMKYKTGDHLGVWPINPDVEVNRLLRVLGLTSRREVPITILSLPLPLPSMLCSVTTLRHARLSPERLLPRLSNLLQPKQLKIFLQNSAARKHTQISSTRTTSTLEDFLSVLLVMKLPGRTFLCPSLSKFCLSCNPDTTPSLHHRSSNQDQLLSPQSSQIQYSQAQTSAYLVSLPTTCWPSRSH